MTGDCEVAVDFLKTRDETRAHGESNTLKNDKTRNTADSGNSTPPLEKAKHQSSISSVHISSGGVLYITI